MKKKEKIDFLNAIKAGHSGVIAGNPAHALDDKTMNAIIHNYVATTEIKANAADSGF